MEQVLTVLDDCVRRGIRTKINAVLLPETRDEPPRLAALPAGGRWMCASSSSCPSERAAA